MIQLCPISEKYINENIARFNALFCFISVLIFILFDIRWLMVLLAFDFYIRAFIDAQFSPIFKASKWLNTTLKLKGKQVNAGPKLFAARIGFIFCLTISILNQFILLDIAVIFAYILIFFAFLEAALNVCVACKLYPFVYRFNYGVKPDNNERMYI